MRRLRDLLLAVASVAVVTTALGPISPPTASGQEPSTAVPVLHIEGRGHGHGIGLSQWGAYSLAAEGAGYADILATFYPGTTLGHAGGEVAVTVDERGEIRVAFPSGGELRSSRSGESPAPQFPISVPPGSVMTIRRSAHGYEVVGTTSPAARGDAVAYRGAGDCVAACPEANQDDCGVFCPPITSTTTTTTTTTTPGGGGSGGGGSGGDGDEEDEEGGNDGGETDDSGSTTTTAPPPPTSPTPIWAVPAEGGTVQSVDRGRTYRGVFEVADGGNGLALRNHLDVETYLMGMAEIPGTWPAAALQAQTVAARTFALRSAGNICDSQRCQVYIGTAGESPGQTAAVHATRGVVVTYNGGLAATHYSASAGGISATPAEGFGTDGEIPYLKAVRHPDVNPQPWKQDVALEVIGQVFNYPGQVSGVKVDEVGPSGRPLSMTIRGDAGPVPVDPLEFREQLGLRSTLYRVSAVKVEKAPPRPKPKPTPDVVGNGRGDLPERLVRPQVADVLPEPVPPRGETASSNVTGPAVTVALLSLAVAATLAAAAVRHLGWRPARSAQ